MRMMLVAVCWSFSLVALAADNWPEFRGPAGNGQSTATGLPLRWSETEKRGLENAHSGTSLVFAGRVGRSDLVNHGH